MKESLFISGEFYPEERAYTIAGLTSVLYQEMGGIDGDTIDGILNASGASQELNALHWMQEHYTKLSRLAFALNDVCEKFADDLTNYNGRITDVRPTQERKIVARVKSDDSNGKNICQKSAGNLFPFRCGKNPEKGK